VVACLVLIWIWIHGSPGGTSPPVKPPIPVWTIFRIEAPEGEIFERIAFPTREVGYAASRQTIYKTVDEGQSWVPIYKSTSPRRVHFLDFENPQVGWLGAEQLYQTSDGGNTWSAVPLPKRMRSVSALARGANGWMLAGGNAADDGELLLFSRLPGKS